MSDFIPKGSKKCLQKILNSVKVKDIFANAENPELSIHFSTNIAELEKILKGEGETFAFLQCELCVCEYGVPNFWQLVFQ